MTSVSSPLGVSPGRSPRIAVLGSANMDMIVIVDRPPGRGETVTGRGFSTVPGGKGANQALAAARAGATVFFLGAVGDDPYGGEIRALLARDGIDVQCLATVGESTGTAHIVVDADGENSIVVVPGANGTVRQLTDDYRAIIQAADVLLLQLELPMEAVVAAAAYATTQHVRVVLTPAPAQPLPADLLDAVDLLVPNEHEAITLAGLTEPDAAAAQLAKVAGEVVVTLGARGAKYHGAGGQNVHVPALPVRATDGTAAGDTFVGYLAVALAEGRAMGAAMRWAAAAAALSVQRLGASTSMPYRDAVDAFAEQETAAR